MNRESIEAAYGHARLAAAGGDPRDARRAFARAVGLARDIGDGGLIAYGLRHLSEIDRDQGDLELALAEAREAATLYRGQAGASKLDLAHALRLAGLALDALDRRDEGARIWIQAQALYRAAGAQAGVEECAARLGRAV